MLNIAVYNIKELQSKGDFTKINISITIW